MKRRLVRLAAAGLCLIVSPVRGDDLPQSIPTGNGLLDLAIAGNPCSLVIILQSTNVTGGLVTCGAWTNNATFGSFGEFQSFLAMKSFGLFNYLSDQNESDVRFIARATYATGAPCPQLSIDTDLGPPEGISAGSFYVTPTFQSVAFGIGNVASASIQFGNNPINPLALVGNRIALGSSFMNGSGGRMRLSVTFSNGETATYTQFGNLITPPSISMFWLPAQPEDPYDDDYYDYADAPYWDLYYQYGWYYNWWYEDSYGYPTYDSYNVVASCTYGADLEIDGTTDFIIWTPVATMTWEQYSGSTQMVIPVQPDASPMMFYRANAF